MSNHAAMSMPPPGRLIENGLRTGRFADFGTSGEVCDEFC